MDEEEVRQEGADAEYRFTGTLVDEGYDARYDRQLDTSYGIDTLVVPGEHGGEPYAGAEIQITLALNSRKKMWEFLKGHRTLWEFPVVRLYVEIWSPEVAPAAARIIGQVLKAALKADAFPTDPIFLRFGPQGAWISSLLVQRLEWVDLVCRRDCRGRLTGRIERIRRGEARVRDDATGTIKRISLRHFAEKEFRVSLRERDGARWEPGTGPRVSYLPGIKSPDGVSEFLVCRAAEPAADDPAHPDPTTQQEQPCPAPDPAPDPIPDPDPTSDSDPTQDPAPEADPELDALPLRKVRGRRNAVINELEGARKKIERLNEQIFRQRSPRMLDELVTLQSNADGLNRELARLECSLARRGRPSSPFHTT